MTQSEFDKLRARHVRTVRGTVLEVGAGNGENFGKFGSTVEWIGLEPDPERRETLRQRALGRGHQREPLDASCESIPLDDASVDVVLGTYVLCSVSDHDAAAAEFRRVLRPGGRLVFAEHVVSSVGWKRAIQTVVTPLSVRFDHGCHWNNNPLPALERAGFEVTELRIEEVENGFPFPSTPEILLDARAPDPNDP